MFCGCKLFIQIVRGLDQMADREVLSKTSRFLVFSLFMNIKYVDRFKSFLNRRLRCLDTVDSHSADSWQNIAF